MCCGTMAHHSGYHGGYHHGDSRGCHTAFRSEPMCFWTQKEQTAHLEQYLDGLREEVKAVEERIAELKGEK